MAIKSVLATVALCLCVQFSFADRVERLSPEEATAYNVMCTGKQDWDNAPMPPDSCAVNMYISCFDEQATMLIECRPGTVYDSEKDWCVPDVNFTRPPGCPTTQQKTYAMTCKDLKMQPGKVPVEGTCKNYTHCDQTGQKVMPCQKLAFFSPETEECEFLPPYSSILSAEFIEKCNRMDPYVG